MARPRRKKTAGTGVGRCSSLTRAARARSGASGSTRWWLAACWGDRVIVGVLLAAGKSSRFGGAQKLVALLGGQPVVRLSAEVLLASGVDRVVAVLGSDAATVRTALSGLPVSFASNERF